MGHYFSLLLTIEEVQWTIAIWRDKVSHHQPLLALKNPECPVLVQICLSRIVYQKFMFIKNSTVKPEKNFLHTLS